MAKMIDELERIRKEVAVVSSRRYLGACLEGLKKTTKILSQYTGVPNEIRTE
jgi:hypothetical protein